MTPVYNVYIYPPTAERGRLERWRKFIASQKFYADQYGVGVKYQYPFRCNHCKAIDHPGGLCPHLKARKGSTTKGAEESDDDDDILPIPQEPGPSNTRPRPPPPGPNQGRNADRKGKGWAPDTTGPGRAKGSLSGGNKGKTTQLKRNGEK